MTSAAPQDTYYGQAWGTGPWGANPGPSAGGWRDQPGASGGPWGQRPWAPFWYPPGIARPMAIALTVLGFIFWWPVGLAVLFYMIGSGRMGCFGRRRRAWMARNGGLPWDEWKAWACGAPASGLGPSSGNHAFDEYKAETLRRLEEEQKEFGAFLERLRFAKDKAEFDQFMAERRNRPPAPPAPPSGEDRPSA
ncbi:DUF2852 domain-containing protein [Rhodopila sp.]|uniref:DUF2852 domain-containing protein n=1 Tax=Rhodopila sp. TaxID=2480087 RepID=UPI002B86A4FF|nr:DUF2852 domain-containing protein [Rhodopila sp.]HVZ07720.1 DUF2852 domain-containing protein [Rhodopila sp.]